MPHRLLIRLLIVLVVLLWALLFAEEAGQTDAAALTDVKDIVVRTVQAVGGKEKVDQVRSFSFRLGEQTVLVSADGRLKVQSGFEPDIVYETLLVGPGGVKKNARGRLEDVTGVEALKWRFLAEFWSGLFSLRNVPGTLALQGVRVFGPERQYCLTSRRDGAVVSYYIDAADFLVRRMVMKASDPATGMFEFVCELGPTEEAEGFRIPNRLYLSQVGVSGTAAPAARGVSKVAVNPALPPDTFSTADVNPGPVAASPGTLNGRVLSVQPLERLKIVFLITNWIRQDIEHARLRSRDRIRLEVASLTFEATFFVREEDAGADPHAYDAGTVLMTNWPDETILYHFQFNPMTQELYDKVSTTIKTWAEIRVTKIAAPGEAR
ncbi:MAG: hypothetical protein OEW05_00710 [Candidatus Aminicenantes bacterium]|nr:hypothetical protein [Candidatus Aminicenantes bacterium]